MFDRQFFSFLSCDSKRAVAKTGHEFLDHLLDFLTITSCRAWVDSFCFFLYQVRLFKAMQILKHALLTPPKKKNVLSFLWPRNIIYARPIWKDCDTIDVSAIASCDGLETCVYALSSRQNKKLCLERHWVEEEYEGNWAKRMKRSGKQRRKQMSSSQMKELDRVESSISCRSIAAALEGKIFMFWYWEIGVAG